MKKLQITTVLLLVLALSLSVLVGCVGHTKDLDDQPLNAPIVADYTKTATERSETFASGSKGYSWENGDPFNTWWNPADVSYANNKLSLSISEMTEKEQTWDEKTSGFKDCASSYYGGEERSEHYYGYGDFQVRMKPAKLVGTASTFFVCTGPYDQWYNEDGTVARSNPHDEIDIEFLGKDTTKVQFNYFANGKGGHEYLYDLGFDASLEYHNYGFRWTEEYITWFVDETPVYKVYRSEQGKNAPWPQTPGRLIMNYWCGTVSTLGWMGAFKNDYSGHADYEWVKCSSTSCPDPISSKPVLPSGPDDPNGETLVAPTTGWTDIAIDGFDGWGMYDVDKTNGLTISHDGDKTGWKCCGMSLPNSYSWVKFHIKNNHATQTAALRIDVKKEGTNAGSVEAVVTNKNVAYDATEGAINIALAAGEETDVVAKIKDEAVNQFVVFLNSAAPSGMATEGSVTITGLQGIANGAAPTPDPDPNPTPDPDPTIPDVTPAEVPTGWNAFDLAGLATWNNNYVVSVKDHAAVISHSKEVVDQYANANKNVVWTSANNIVRLVIKNEGTVAAFVKTGVQDASYKCVLSAASLNGTELESSAFEWGVFTTIPAGETVTIEMVVDLAKAPDAFFISMNSDEALGSNAKTGCISVNAYCKGIPAVELNIINGWLGNEYEDVYDISLANGVMTAAYAKNDTWEYMKRTLNNETADSLKAVKTLVLEGKLESDYTPLNVILKFEYQQGYDPKEVNFQMSATSRTYEWDVSELNLDHATRMLIFVQGGKVTSGTLTISKFILTSKPINQENNVTKFPVQTGGNPDTTHEVKTITATDTAIDAGWYDISDGVYTIAKEGTAYKVDFKKNGNQWPGMAAYVTGEAISQAKSFVVTLNGTAGTRIMLKPFDDNSLEKIVTLSGGDDEFKIDIAEKAAVVDTSKELRMVIIAEPGNETAKGSFTIKSAEFTIEPKPAGDWTALNLSSFDGWGKYTVDKTEGIRISHEAKIDMYGCCGADIDTASLTERVKVTLKNNAETTSYVKVCIKNDKDEKAAIVSATINGEAVGYVEYGALVELAGGAEAEVILVLDLSKAPDKFVISMNSEGGDDAAKMPAAGDITITGAFVESTSKED